MLYIGTSGYSFKEWVGPFYPAKTPGKKYLAFYASLLNTVEINHTFRRFPTRELTASWAAETPESFRFSVKVHQSITHQARLKDVGASVKDFLRGLDPLGPRFGAILFQLPPYFPINLERLEKLLRELPTERKFAFEFRHPSWYGQKTVDLLRDAGMAFCFAEVEIGGEIQPITAPYAYLRLRKAPPYSEKEVDVARQQMRQILSLADDLYVYIKHDGAGLAPQMARALSPSGSEILS